MPFNRSTASPARPAARSRAGYEWETRAITYYLLCRLEREQPTITAELEGLSDGLITYGTHLARPNCIELLEAKVRTHPDVSDQHNWQRKSISQSDLMRLIEPLAKRWETLSDEMKRDSYSTLLLFGELEADVRKYRPNKLTLHSEASEIGRLSRHFYAQYQHTFPNHGHAQLLGHLPAPRLRVLELPDLSGLRHKINNLLSEQFNISDDNVQAAQTKLYDLVSSKQQAYTGPQNRLSGQEILTLIQPFERGKGTWIQLTPNSNKAEDDQSSSEPLEFLSPKEFLLGKRLSRIYSDLINQRSLIFSGPLGMGKTTALHYLASRFFDEYPNNNVYLLLCQPGMDGYEEIAYLSERVATGSLFLVDDAELAPKFMSNLLRLAQNPARQCCIAVSTAAKVARFSLQRLTTTTELDGHQGANRLLFGWSVKNLAPLPQVQMKYFVAELASARDITLPNDILENVAAMARGNPGRADLALRSIAPSLRAGSHRYPKRNSKAFRSLYERWIELATGRNFRADRISFPNQILPFFLVAAIGLDRLPPVRRSSLVADILQDAGLIELCANSSPLQFTVVDPLLAGELLSIYPELLESVVSKYLEQYDDEVPLSIELLIRNALGRSAIRALWPQVRRQLRERCDNDELTLEQSLACMRGMRRMVLDTHGPWSEFCWAQPKASIPFSSAGP